MKLVVHLAQARLVLLELFAELVGHAGRRAAGGQHLAEEGEDAVGHTVWWGRAQFWGRAAAGGAA